MRSYWPLFLVILSSPAVAQNMPDSAGLGKDGIADTLQLPSYNLSEVTVTAFHNPEKLRNAAGAVSVLQVDTLKLPGYNLVSSLSASPGLNIQEASAGTMKLTLRGIGSRYPYGTRKIKMFLDGIPLYSAEGETYFDDISPEYISRIEVLRGPASSIYGASLGGAVVLYPALSDGSLPEISLMSTAGSYGYLKNSLGFSYSTQGNDIGVYYSGVHSDGYRQNSLYDRNSLMLALGHRFSERLSVSMLLTGTVTYAQIPSSIDSLTYETDPGAAAPAWLKTKGNKTPERLLAGIKLKYKPSRAWDMTGALFTTLRANEENRPFNFLEESDISAGGRYLATYSGKKDKVSYRFTAGTNIFLEQYNNSIYANPGGNGIRGDLQQKGTEFIYQADIFTQADVSITRFTFSGGFNFNQSGFRFTDQYSSDSVDQSGISSFKPVFSPRLSVSWNPSSGLSFFAALNNGFSIPSLSETMTPAGLINNDIKPEKAWSLEAGARAEIFKKRTFLDLALYYMKVSDLIVPKRVEEDFYVGMNAGASLHRGIEIAIRQWLAGNDGENEQSPFSAVLNVSASFNSFRFLDFTDDENNFDGNRLPGVPEISFNGNISMRIRAGFSARVEILSSGKIPLDDFNSGYADAWTVLNAQAGYGRKLGRRWRIDGLISVSNITNEHYASMVVVNAPGTPERPPRYYYPGMPLWYTFSLGLKYRFVS